MAGVLLGVRLAHLRLDGPSAGVVVAAGLAGAATASALVMFRGDAWGPRATLLALALVGGAAGIACGFPDSAVPLAALAFAGMLNGMGRDRSAALVVEQALLPAAVPDRERTRAFAWYGVLQDAGHAAGSLLAVLPGVLQGRGLAPEAAFRASFGVYGVLLLLPISLYLGLSRGLTAPVAGRHPVSAGTRRILWTIAPLFALDALGSGFLTTALLAFFFYERFGVDAAALGPLFFGARVANALSHLAAARLADRIGLVNTMVFTHIPSSLLLVTVAFAPSFPVAAVLFLLREGLVEMDVPTRQSYLMAVVAPHERTFVSALTSLVRMSSWALAPLVAGAVMGGVGLMAPLVAGAALKITYDVLLWRAFRHRPAPEER